MTRTLQNIWQEGSRTYRNHELAELICCCWFQNNSGGVCRAKHPIPCKQHCISLFLYFDLGWDTAGETVNERNNDAARPAQDNETKADDGTAKHVFFFAEIVARKRCVTRANALFGWKIIEILILQKQANARRMIRAGCLSVGCRRAFPRRSCALISLISGPSRRFALKTWRIFIN